MVSFIFLRFTNICPQYTIPTHLSKAISALLSRSGKDKNASIYYRTVRSYMSFKDFHLDSISPTAYCQNPVINTIVS